MMNLLSEEKSLPQKISEDIIAFILEENLQPGDKLPNETILSERLNAGRSSVREAMKLLASRNIVTIRQGSGTYIASSPGMVDDPLGFTFIGNKQKLINDLLEVRFLLEPPIAAMAATRADKKDIKKITALCDEVEELLRKHEDHTQGYRVSCSYCFKQQKCCSSKTGSCDQQLDSSVCRDHQRYTAGRNHRDPP